MTGSRRHELSIAGHSEAIAALLDGLRHRGMSIGPDDAAKVAAAFQHARGWSRERCVRSLKALLARNEQERQLLDQLAPLLFVHAEVDAAPRMLEGRDRLDELRTGGGLNPKLGDVSRASALDTKRQPWGAWWVVGLLLSVVAAAVILNYPSLPTQPLPQLSPDLGGSVEAVDLGSRSDAKPLELNALEVPPPLAPTLTTPGNTPPSTNSTIVPTTCTANAVPELEQRFLIFPFILGLLLCGYVLFRATRLRRQVLNLRSLARATGPRIYQLRYPQDRTLSPLDPEAVREAAFHLSAPSAIIESGDIDPAGTVLATSRSGGLLELRFLRTRAHRPILFIEDVSLSMARWPEHASQLVQAMRRQGADVIHRFMDGLPENVSLTAELRERQPLEQVLLGLDMPTVVIFSDAAALDQGVLRRDWLGSIAGATWLHPRPANLWDGGARALSQYLSVVPVSAEGLMRLGAPYSPSSGLPDRWRIPKSVVGGEDSVLRTYRAALGKDAFRWLMAASILDHVGGLDARMLWALRDEGVTPVPWLLAERIWEVPGIACAADGVVRLDPTLRRQLLLEVQRDAPDVLRSVVAWAEKLIKADIAALEGSTFGPARILAQSICARMVGLWSERLPEAAHALQSLVAEGYGPLLAGEISGKEKSEYRLRFQLTVPRVSLASAGFCGLLVSFCMAGLLVSRPARQRIHASVWPRPPAFLFLNQRDQERLILESHIPMRFCDQNYPDDPYVWVQVNDKEPMLLRGSRSSDGGPYEWNLTSNSAMLASISIHKDSRMRLGHRIQPSVERVVSLIEEQGKKSTTQINIAKDETVKPALSVPSGSGIKKDAELEALEKTLAQVRGRHDVLAEARTLSKIGDRQRKLLKLKEALSSHKEALSIFSTLGNNKERAFSLQSIGTVLFELGDYKQASETWRSAQELLIQIFGSDAPETLEATELLANAYLSLGNYEASLQLTQHALAISSKKNMNPILNARWQYTYAKLMIKLGRLSDAEEGFRQSLEMRQRLLGMEHPEVAISLNGLASVLLEQGKIEEAEPLYRRALAIQDAVLGKDDIETAKSLAMLAGLLQARGKLDEAELLYRRSYYILERALGLDHPKTLNLLLGLAEVLQARGKLDEAESLCRRALAGAESALGPAHPTIAQSMALLGELLQERGKLEESEALFRRALSINESVLGRNHPAIAKSMELLAGSLQARGKFEESEALFRRALAVNEKALGREDSQTGTTLYKLAVLLLSMGKNEDALQALSAVVHIREISLRASPTEDFATGLLRARLAERRFIYALPILLPGNRRALDIALRTSLLHKGRAQDIGETLGQALRTGLRTPEQRLHYERFQQLLKRREELFFVPDGDFMGQQRSRDDRFQEERKLLWDAQRLEQELAQQLGVNNRVLIPSMDRILEAVAAKIPRGAALVEVVTGYMAPHGRISQDPTGELHYIAFVLFPDSTAQAVDLGTQEHVHRVVEAFRQELRDAAHKNTNNAQLAYSLLFSKLDSLLVSRAVRRLLVSPDHVLHLIPWAALYDGKQYLIDRFSISYLDSGRDLLRPVSTVSSQPALIVAAPDNQGQAPLPNVRRTGVEISRLLGAKPLLGGEAMKESLRRHPNPSTLVLATHGSFRGPFTNTDDAMLRSFLIIGTGRTAAATTQDGLLTAEEVRGLSLGDTQLVTLLTSEGALGATIEGEGVYGLRRAFMQAGAETVVGALWSVQEASACEVALIFYEKLVNGRLGRVQALEDAMKEVRARPNYGHPFYWAPFIAVGMDGPLRLPAHGTLAP